MHDIDHKVLGELRALTSDDLELILRWRNDARIRSNMYSRHVIAPAEHLAWWRNMDRKANSYLVYSFAGSKTGVVAFNGIDQINGVSSWAFYADPEAKRGFGGKMEFLALEYAFNHLRLRKLQCEVLGFNQPVLNLHAKFGFKEEGLFLRHHRYNEEFINVHRLAIFQEDWKELRAPMLDRLTSRSEERP